MTAKKKTKSRVDILNRVASDVKDIKFVSEIEEERFVPTLITSFNRAIGIGGLPLRRMIIVHGKNSSGKSSFALILAESMRMNGHIPIVFDTEHAAEKRWYKLLSSGGDETLFKMPKTMNEMIKDTNKFFANMRDLRKENSDYNEIGLCFVIDTITKLIPEDLFKKIEKEGVEKAYPIQALLTSFWMKYIIPVLYRENSTAVIVLQDRKNMDRKTPYDAEDKPSGGESLQYDNSIRIHFEKPSKTMSGDKTTVIGWKHPFKIEKNKVDGITFSKGAFYTGTGNGYIPKGLDNITEAIEEAKFRDWFGKYKSDNDGKQYTRIANGEYAIDVKGGDKQVWKHFFDNGDDFKKFVDALNADAMRDDE